MERALNALGDDGFGAIVQHMRDAPSDPTAPRPQKETSGCLLSCFKPSKHVCYRSRLHVLMMIFALTAPCEFLIVSGCRC